MSGNSQHIAEIDGVRVPQFLYGTAWKEEQTRPLTLAAIRAGFRGIDTANQRRHYFEAAVGEAIGEAIQSGLVTRDDLFLQTKYTFQRGQDHRLPFDPKAPISAQVEQSFASSLEHLGTDRVDSYVLHGPTLGDGLVAPDWEAWRAMEEIHDSGRVRFLGVSNVTLEQLRALCKEARIQPRFVQNRCFATAGWDFLVREFCLANKLHYQGFSLLTANRVAVTHPTLNKIAQKHKVTAAQVVFRFALDVGMIPLTGTTSPDHMKADLEAFDFELEILETKRIERLAIQNLP